MQMALESSSTCMGLGNSMVGSFREVVEGLDKESRKQLEILKLENVESTGKELGRGAYGVVTELVVNGLR